MSMMRMMTASGPWAAISVIGKGGLHRPSQKSELSHFLRGSSLSIYHHYLSIYHYNHHHHENHQDANIKSKYIYFSA